MQHLQRGGGWSRQGDDQASRQARTRLNPVAIIDRNEHAFRLAGLTERQVQVLRLLGQGCTNAEIADRLVMSTRTVDSHVAAVLAKRGVATTCAAAAGRRTRGSSTRKLGSRRS